MSHIHEKVDFTVETFIVYKNKVLLRKHDKYKIWLSVGGHVELHEDPNETAVREVWEETGLHITFLGKIPVTESSDTYRELLAPRYLNRHRVSDTHEHVTLVYFATSDTDSIQQGECEVSDDIRWFTKEELDSPQYELRNNIRFYSKKALEAFEKEAEL